MLLFQESFSLFGDSPSLMETLQHKMEEMGSLVQNSSSATGSDLLLRRLTLTGGSNMLSLLLP
jgi:hypothetical protein